LQKSYAILSFVAIFLMFSTLVSASGPSVYATQQVESTTTYPIAFHFSLRIDPYNNHWYANVTNVGSRALAQFGVLLFNSSGYEITANSTALAGIQSLKPYNGINFKTVCSDYYYSGAPCIFRSGESYGISVIAWIGSCSCDHEIQISGKILANNQVYSLSTYPMIALSSNSKVTVTNWSQSITNLGTKTAKVSSEIYWSWTPCNNPGGCYGSKTTQLGRIGSGSSTHFTTGITKPHRASRGTEAEIYITASYIQVGYRSWTAQLTISQNVIIG
jgi:hypothetical protein